MDTLEKIGALLKQARYPSTDQARVVLGGRAYADECCAAWEADLAAKSPLRTVKTTLFYGVDCDWTAHPDEVRLEVEG